MPLPLTRDEIGSPLTNGNGFPYAEGWRLRYPVLRRTIWPGQLILPGNSQSDVRLRDLRRRLPRPHALLHPSSKRIASHQPPSSNNHQHRNLNLQMGQWRTPKLSHPT